MACTHAFTGVVRCPILIDLLNLMHAYRLSGMGTACTPGIRQKASMIPEPTVDIILAKDVISLIEHFRRNRQTKRFGSFQVDGELNR